MLLHALLLLNVFIPVLLLQRLMTMENTTVLQSVVFIPDLLPLDLLPTELQSTVVSVLLSLIMMTCMFMLLAMELDEDKRKAIVPDLLLLDIHPRENIPI